jgi:hypothetical protein
MEWRGFSNVSMMTRWYSYQFFFLKACQSVRLCSFCIPCETWISILIQLAKILCVE